MKKLFFHIVILLLVLAPLTSSASGPFGRVRGTVKGIDGVLVGATISADNRTELTDQNGQFIFLLRPGTHFLTVSHVGYSKITKEIKIKDVQQVVTVEFVMEPVSQLDEVVLLGTRSLTQRSNLHTPVPVDIFTYDNLLNTGRPGLAQMLNVMAPSLSVSRELIYESITLRGLNPDQTLILLNGTRYHNMAYIQADGIRGHIGKGSVANDINSIPFSGIEKVEILRDGATSQYGSDAIAAVMDIQLKKSTGKTSIQFHTGEHYKGDGENISLGVYRGFKLSNRGFLTLSADLRFRQHTHRGGIFDGTIYKPLSSTASYADSVRIRAEDNATIKASNFDRNIVSNAGNSELLSGAILVNGGYPVSKKTELFFTAAVSSRKNTYLAAYVFPKNERQVNKLLFPDGFRPRPMPFNRDVSTIAGLRGETKNSWRWELISSYGSNRSKYKIENTNNASQEYTLGIYAPTKFYAGSLIYGQLTNTINFVKELSKKNEKVRSLTLGLGAEWRMENYQIKAGEEAAWQTYDLRKQGGAQIALILRPDDEINKTRNVIGTYIDIGVKLSDKLLLNPSSRYEYYNDFGSNLAGKLAIHYKILKRLSLRGSFGNGFRAPSIQQRWYSATTIGYRNTGSQVPSTRGIFPNNHKIALAFGIPSLGPEKSLNLSTGLTATLFNRLRLTVDAYWIQIKDRIVQSGVFDTANNKDVAYIIRTNAFNVDQVQFFSNAVNTKTMGIDIVVNSTLKFRKARLTAVLAANFTGTCIFGEVKVAKNLNPDSLNTNTLFGRQERMKMEKGQPDHKIILSLNYKIGKLEFVLRNTRFGNTAITANDLSFSHNQALDEHLSSKILTDINVNYSLNKWLILTGGANNVFNVYPDRIKNYINTGQGQYIYTMEASPFGFNGGYYYVSMSFTF